MPLYTPRELLAHVEEQASLIGTSAFVTRRENNRLREMWCASKFGIGFSHHHAPCQIEVEERDEQRDYDFHLRVGEECLPFQVLEALDSGRRRDLEYRSLNPAGRIETELPSGYRSSSYASQRVRSELQKKINKHYATPSELHVLVYLNVNAASVSWASLAGSAEAEVKVFASVWVVTGELFCCIHSGKRWHGLVGWKRIDAES